MATKSRALRLLKDTIGAGAVRTGRWPNKASNHTRRHPAASGGASPHQHLRTARRCARVREGSGMPPFRVRALSPDRRAYQRKHVH